MPELTIPKHQSVVVVPTPHASFEVDGKYGVAQPAAGQLLVKVYAIGLNPVDWKVQKNNPNYLPLVYPLILGSDAAGEVVALGEGVTGFTIGDRVFFQGFFTNELATFKQYTIAIANITSKIPNNISYDEAASIPLGLATAALAFYPPKPAGFGLTPPWEAGGIGKYANQPILIYGGASSVGQFAIQCAKLSGFSPIITTASLSHSEYLKSLGATHIIDRHAPLAELSPSIKAITSLPIEYGYDAIGAADIQQAVYDIIADNGKITIVLPQDIAKLDASSGKRVFQVLGNVHVPDVHQDKPHTLAFCASLTRLLENGDLKPNRVKVIPGGIEGIITGLKELEKGVSGVKLIAHPHD